MSSFFVNKIYFKFTILLALWNFIFIESKDSSKLGTIYGKVILAKREAFRYNLISVSLEGSNRTAFVNEKGFFIFYNVEDGNYIININDPIYEYEQKFAEVSDKKAKIFSFDQKFGKKSNRNLEEPFEINSIMKIKYEEDSPNVLNSIVKSPYAIIIGLTGLLYLCMKLLPQDQLKEMEDMNKQMGQFQNMFKQK